MAKRGFGEKPTARYESVRFQVRFSNEEYHLILAISEILRNLFNSALAERQHAFSTFIAPLYERLKWAGLAEGMAQARSNLKHAYEEHSITLFDQINALTAKRASDPGFAAIPRNWQEETLDALDGAYKSFLSLRKRGDYDARPPRPREEGFFQKIPGRFGFKIIGDRLVLSIGKGGKLSFPIPEYQRQELEKATELKKFELYRDDPNLSKTGRFWVSIAYELPRAEQVYPERLVFLSLGASSLGVVSEFGGEEVLKLWRADKHWQPLIERVEESQKQRSKGSNGWKILQAAKRRMQTISSRQMLQDEREIVDYLLRKHGNHFVVSDLVVRSKAGALADSTRPERRGRLGLNWAAQNIGSIARLVLLLEHKVKEFGGSVRRHKLVLDEAPPGEGHENKLWMAKKLRESFLTTRV